MRYIHWYAAFAAASAGLYIVMLCADWWTAGRPDLAATREFLSFLLSGSAVAAIGFAARWLVDRDENGVPDVLEKDGTESELK